MAGGTRERPLRGRAAELAAIGARLDEVRSGVGSVIIVEGRAGLGKTRLLDACASMAAERSFRVGRGVAEPHRRVVELDVLFDALFGGGEPLLARNALSDQHASPEQRFWLLQDIQALIEAEALRGPLLICLDDLHLVGEGCAMAMRQLPQQLASLPVGWVMAFRPDQGLPSVQSTKAQLEDAGAEVVRLGPLRREAVTQVAVDVLGAEPDDDLLRKADQVRGNPFLLIEFFRGLQDERLVAVEAGRARLVEDRLPRRVSDTMRARLLRMSPAASRLATLASALGRRFSVHELAQMAGMPITELLDPVQELAQADIFTESGERLAFGHDLIREAVRASSPSRSAGRSTVRRPTCSWPGARFPSRWRSNSPTAPSRATKPPSPPCLRLRAFSARATRPVPPGSPGGRSNWRLRGMRSVVPLSRGARFPCSPRACSRRRPDSPLRLCGRHCPPRKRPGSAWR